jgi:hypothetical protein
LLEFFTAAAQTKAPFTLNSALNLSLRTLKISGVIEFFVVMIRRGKQIPQHTPNGQCG